MILCQDWIILIQTVIGILFCIKSFATHQTNKSLYLLKEVVLGEIFGVLRFKKQLYVDSSRFYAACVIDALNLLLVVLAS